MNNEIGYLDEWENKVCDGFFGEKFGLVDIVVYCCTFNLFRYVMVPTWRDLYPKISFSLSHTRSSFIDR